MFIRFISIPNGKEMANGMRDTSGLPLSPEEIDTVIKEAKRINIDTEILIFNSKEHKSGTAYNFAIDKIYVERNVFPDTKYASVHPRDIMSIACVLAHEYYGHRIYKDEYLSDSLEQSQNTAAKITPNLTQRERFDYGCCL